MSQITTRPAGYRQSASNNVYTVLILVAFLALLIAGVFVYLKNKELTDNANPFYVMPKDAGAPGR